MVSVDDQGQLFVTGGSVTGSLILMQQLEDKLKAHTYYVQFLKSVQLWDRVSHTSGEPFLHVTVCLSQHFGSCNDSYNQTVFGVVRSDCNNKQYLDSNEYEYFNKLQFCLLWKFSSMVNQLPGSLVSQKYSNLTVTRG